MNFASGSGEIDGTKVAVQRIPSRPQINAEMKAKPPTTKDTKEHEGKKEQPRIRRLFRINDLLVAMSSRKEQSSRRNLTARLHLHHRLQELPSCSSGDLGPRKVPVSREREFGMTPRYCNEVQSQYRHLECNHCLFRGRLAGGTMPFIRRYTAI